MAKFNKDSVGGTLTVVVLLSLICSIVVAGAAVALKSTQDVQKQLDKQKNILQAAGLMQEKTNVQEVYAKFIEPRIVDLETGEYAEVANFDAKAFAKNPATSVAIDPADDEAGIKVRAKFAEIYLVKDENGNVDQLVLPMYGNGLWSTMYGFLSLSTDVNTVKGLTYYDQAETAGLGDLIAKPDFQSRFVNKKLFNEKGEVALTVRKGALAQLKEHGVDGLSGATLTTKGVDGSIKYWFGPKAFGPFLAKFKATSGAN